MRKLLTAIGRFVVGLFCRVGRFGIFSWTLLMRLGGARLSHVVQQIHFSGNYSLLIIAVSGLFVGFVLGLQGYYVLVKFTSGPDFPAELDRVLGITDGILRSLITRRPE